MKTLSFTLLSSFVLCLQVAISGQTLTTSDGTWSTSGNWSSGVPGSGSTATITHDMLLDTDLNIGTGGSYVINGGSITDPEGGDEYDITVSGNGNLEVNGNLTVGGSVSLSNNSVVNIKSCDTLRVRGDFNTTGNTNNSMLNIETCAVLIIEGDFEIG